MHLPPVPGFLKSAEVEKVVPAKNYFYVLHIVAERATELFNASVNHLNRHVGRRTAVAVVVAALLTSAAGTAHLIYTSAVRVQRQRMAHIAAMRADMALHLFMLPRCPWSPSICPEATKLETFLRLAHIPYHVVETTNAHGSPNGELPFAVFRGHRIADMTMLLELVVNHFGRGLDGHLTKEERNTGTNLLSSVEYSLRPVFFRVVMDEHPDLAAALMQASASAPFTVYTPPAQTYNSFFDLHAAKGATWLLPLPQWVKTMMRMGSGGGGGGGDEGCSSATWRQTRVALTRLLHDHFGQTTVQCLPREQYEAEFSRDCAAVEHQLLLPQHPHQQALHDLSVSTPPPVMMLAQTPPSSSCADSPLKLVDVEPTTTPNNKVPSSRPFLFGAEPTSYDCTLYALLLPLAHLHRVPEAEAILGSDVYLTVARSKSLMYFLQSMTERAFPEMQATMQLFEEMRDERRGDAVPHLASCSTSLTMLGHQTSLQH